MSSIKNISLILIGALLIGLGCSIFFVLTFSYGQIPPQARWFDFWIPLVILFFMIILIRSRKPVTEFHFWEGLMSGNLMIWTGGLLSGVFLWIFASISPEFFETFISSSIRYLKEFNQYAPEARKTADIGLKIAEFQKIQPSDMILDEARQKLFYSFLLVPFVSVILRRK